MNPLDTGEEFQLELMNPNPTSSKTKDGPKYRVSFEVDRETWQNFMDANTSGMILEFTGRATEIPVTKIEADRPKGGVVSKAAAMLSQDPLTDQFAQERDYKDFKSMVYSTCGITSRAELDHNEKALQAFERLKSDFIRWAHF